MITSLFGKSKPFNFLILGFVLTVALLWSQLRYTEDTDFTFFSNTFFSAFLLFFCLWLLEFITYKNRLTQNNHFALFFFVCYLIGVMHLNIEPDAIWPLIFVVLAVRRILAFRTTVDFRQKIFDAAFWLTVGMFFNFWIILFFVLLYLALLDFNGAPSRLWLIPLIASFSVLFPVFAYCFLFDKIDHFTNFFTIDTTNYSVIWMNHKTFWFMVITFCMALFSLYFYVKKLKLKASNQKKTRQHIVVGYFISLAVYFLSHQVHPDVILLMIPFLSVLSVAFVEDYKKKLMLESYLFLILIGMIGLVFW
ncbi:MAG: hypothetical protein CO119_10860 [Flavobacteriales bacterium CG_4_9_14_3_um_filter_40_17]|nr:MAG: hypothetical protein CO119_10860 [Flavobacteriales bacterium CG_4_9_14_3_um_filter_40_17]